MRIITGSARGRRLRALPGLHTRPTPERVKEALFSVLQFYIEGRHVLDLFAGSGQLGLEALSRGAAEAVFVDADKNAIAVIEENVELCNFTEKSKIFHMDYAAFFLRNQKRFDIAFLDPPYQDKSLENALRMTARVMQEGGTIVCEHPADKTLPESVHTFCRKRTNHYGKVALTFYQHKDVIHA